MDIFATVLAASGLGSKMIVIGAAVVVVLAIVVVFIMVLRSDSSADKRTERGLAFDPDEGPGGQSYNQMAPARRSSSGPDQRMSGPMGAGANDAAHRPAEFGGTVGSSGTPSRPQAPSAAWGNRGWSDDAPVGAPPRGRESAWGQPQPETPPWGQRPGPQPAGQNWGNGPAAPANGPAMPGVNDPARGWPEQAPQQPAGWPDQQQQQGWGAPGSPPSRPATGWGEPAPQVGGWAAPGGPMPPQGGPGMPPPMAPPAQSGWGAPPANDPAAWRGGPAMPPPQQQPPMAPPAQSGWGAPPANDPAAAWQQQAPVSAPRSTETRMAYVIVREGKEPGRTYELRRDRLTIGRSRESDVFLEDLAVSRLHASIYRDDQGSYILRDENSANGTSVNGQRITEHRLSEGDDIQVGQTTLTFTRR